MCDESNNGRALLPITPILLSRKYQDVVFTELLGMNIAGVKDVVYGGRGGEWDDTYQISHNSWDVGIAMISNRWSR